MVNRIVVERTIEFLKKMMHKAAITIDGLVIEKEIHSIEVVKDTIKAYVYLDGHGAVTKAILIDAQGIELDNYESQISQNPNGLVIVFEWALNLKGVTNL
ncbi:hypothetical protein [Lysinibacillus fusiformis]|uniref:hypothetical protein n=1 Tax=Lysinibacillus fusiformis TaxID=28031 RepID=UPI0011A67FE3|nr:hypothetical protein [Lysinibacillus fusiformis]